MDRFNLTKIINVFLKNSFITLFACLNPVDIINTKPMLEFLKNYAKKINLNQKKNSNKEKKISLIQDFRLQNVNFYQNKEILFTKENMKKNLTPTNVRKINFDSIKMENIDMEDNVTEKKIRKIMMKNPNQTRVDFQELELKLSKYKKLYENNELEVEKLKSENLSLKKKLVEIKSENCKNYFKEFLLKVENEKKKILNFGHNESAGNIDFFSKDVKFETQEENLFDKFRLEIKRYISEAASEKREFEKELQLKIEELRKEKKRYQNENGSLNIIVGKKQNGEGLRAYKGILKIFFNEDFSCLEHASLGLIDSLITNSNVLSKNLEELKLRRSVNEIYKENSETGNKGETDDAIEEVLKLKQKELIEILTLLENLDFKNFKKTKLIKNSEINYRSLNSQIIDPIKSKEIKSENNSFSIFKNQAKRTEK